MTKELTYTIEDYITVDVEQTADMLADYLREVWEDLGIEYREREAIDETEVLKEIAKYWLKTL